MLFSAGFFCFYKGASVDTLKFENSTAISSEENFFTVSGSYATVNEAVKGYTNCLKLESSAGTVTFTIDSEKTLTAIVSDGNININIVNGTSTEKVAGSDNTITKKLSAGTYTLKKADAKNFSMFHWNNTITITEK